ncbi:MAG: hypothetical protein WC785_00875 [Tatlockia sp.]|jgi:hypothetical protein
MLSFIPKDSLTLLKNHLYNNTWRTLLSQPVESTEHFNQLAINLFLIALGNTNTTTPLLNDLWDVLKNNLTSFFKDALANAVPSAITSLAPNAMTDAQPAALQPEDNTRFYRIPYQAREASQFIRLAISRSIKGFVEQIISQENINWLISHNTQMIRTILNGNISKFKNNLAQPLFYNNTVSPLMLLILQQAPERRVQAIHVILGKKLTALASYTLLVDVENNNLIDPEQFKPLKKVQLQFKASCEWKRSEFLQTNISNAETSAAKKRQAPKGFFTPVPKQPKTTKQDNAFSETAMNAVVVNLMEFVYEQVKHWPRDASLQAFHDLMNDKELLSVLKETTPEQNIIDIDANEQLLKKLPTIMPLFNSSISLPHYPTSDQPTAPAMYLALCYNQLDKIYKLLAGQAIECEQAVPNWR